MDEKPTEDYSDIGGLDKQARPTWHGPWRRCSSVAPGAAHSSVTRPTSHSKGMPLRTPGVDVGLCVLTVRMSTLQIQELREAIVLPITHRDRFVKLGIKPPKGVLLHGPPGGQVWGARK